MRHWLLRDILSAFESAEPAYRADTVDEYRELAMLAQAWEYNPLEPGSADGAPGRIDGARSKESAPR